MLYILLLVAAMSIGYLAQTTGLCLVRGVDEWFDGRRLRLLAILLAGFWIYAYVPLAASWGVASRMLIYEPHWGFFLGGVLFGLGAAGNGACAVSTASRLSSGELVMLFTMMGWLLGWLLLNYAGYRIDYGSRVYAAGEMSQLAMLFISSLVAIGAAVFYWRRRAWRMWRGIMVVGILAGLLRLYQTAWFPSDFVRDLGLAVATHNLELLPSIDRIGILLLMVVGMWIGAWQYRHFRWRWPTMAAVAKHLLSGIMMGMGTALAMGGNDFQLLLAIPALSVAGITTVIGMIAGIRAGRLLTLFSKRPDAGYLR